MQPLIKDEMAVSVKTVRSRIPVMNDLTKETNASANAVLNSFREKYKVYNCES